MRLIWKILIVLSILILLIAIILLVAFRKMLFKTENKQPFKNIWKDTDKYGRKNMDIILQIFTDINKVFKKHSISYFFVFGNLLGLMRHNDLIPWDDDVDICVSKEDFQKILDSKRDLNKLGLDVEKFPNLGVVKNILRIYRINADRAMPTRLWGATWPFIDINYYEDEGDNINVITPGEPDEIYAKKDIFPLKPWTLHGITIYIPNNPKAILDYNYKNWDKEVIESDTIHRDFTFIKNRKKIPMSQLQEMDDKIFNSVWIVSTNSGKREKVQNKLRDIGIPSKTWPGVKPESRSLLDLYEEINNPEISKDELSSLLSHYSLWMHLKENDYPYAIIFENDISFSHNISKELLLIELNESAGFMLLFLGHNNENLVKKPSTYVGHANGRHAYAVSRAGISQLCELGNQVLSNLNDMTNKICKTELCFLSHTDEERGKNKGGGIFFKQRDILTDKV